MCFDSEKIHVSYWGGGGGGGSGVEGQGYSSYYYSHFKSIMFQNFISSSSFFFCILTALLCMFIAQQDKYVNKLTPQQGIVKCANKTNRISANRTQFQYCDLGSWFPLHFLAFKDPHPIPLEFPIPSVCVCGR